MAPMDKWNRVKWTEAAQIAERLDWDQDLGADARAAPRDFFVKLRTVGRLNDAVFFLGQALPRYETVAWAARAVLDTPRPTPSRGPDAEALKAALLWVQDPSDARRRAAFDAAGKARTVGAERLVALAAFFSGGSLTPAEVQPVQAPNESAGLFAAGAVLLAAAESGDQDAALNRALDAGSMMAARGVGAGAA
ncbi:MAG TPA: hypothetical protein VFC47_11675 [Caulobacteraceae bacterium]|nr:hypothetical protein [Caulobacteraceae bacterium]